MTRAKLPGPALLLSLACLSAAACGEDDPVPPLPADGGADAGPGDTGTSTGTDAGIDAGVGDAGVIVDQCNPLTQTGCADPVESRCAVEGPPRAGAQCVEPPDMEKMLGDVCAALECGAGLVCVRTATVARCHQLCDRQTGMGCEALGSDYDCRLLLRDTNWNACAELPPLCDAVTQAPCEAGAACQFITRFDGTFELRCVPAGPGMDGDTCGGANPACGRGFICVRENAGSVCRKTCGGDADCAGTCSGTAQNVRYCR